MMLFKEIVRHNTTDFRKRYKEKYKNEICRSEQKNINNE